MAYDLHERFRRLRPTTYSAPPSASSQFPLSRENEKNSRIRPFDRGQSYNLRATELSASDPPWTTTADTSLIGDLVGSDKSHASTPPINVPASTLPDAFLQCLPPEPPLNGSPYTPSPLENFLRNRGPSISFNPQVTLESGQRRGLEEPLPKLEIDTRLRRRPILQDLSRHTPSSPLARAYIEAERCMNDPIRGERGAHHLQSGSEEVKSPTLLNGSHHPLPPPTIQTLADEKGQADLEEGASLTSDSTASSILSEINTPKDDNTTSRGSPTVACPPIHHSASLQDVNTWPILQPLYSIPRAKSYSFNRKGDIRPGYRPGSRRSTNSSSSPASAFLSRFAREESAAAPDDEGQEVGEYVLGRQVGFGGSSVVKEAFSIEGDTRVCRAVKIVRKHVANTEDLENERFQAEFEREVDLWRCLSHRHILSLIAVHVTPFATFCFTPLSSGGTLFDLVRTNRHGLHGELARRYSYQLASAIRYLHEDMRVVHRDIKLENCLIDWSNRSAHPDGGHLLLCDFGLAEFEINDHRGSSPDPYGQEVRSTSIDPTPMKTSFVGSLEYASPELIRSPSGFFSRAIDIWALGVVIYALLLGDLPFQHSLPSRVQSRILDGDWDANALQQAAAAGGTEDVVEVVHGCLNTRSDERWAISQVLDSRWFHGCPEILDKTDGGWRP